MLSNAKKSIDPYLPQVIPLIFLVMLQLGFWYKTKDIKPEMEIVPPAPSREALRVMSFGDDEFYFRVLTFNMQNFGDTFGRFTPLKDYSFEKLYNWFNLLDALDAKSDMVPAMATYYFSQTQNTKDVHYVVDYLYTHSTRDVSKKWWWLVQAIYLSMHKLEDKDLALKVSKPLVNEDVPAWAQQMAAVVREKRGEFADALSIMETIKDNAKNISDKDLKYMTYFIKERIGKLDKIQKQKSKSEYPETAPKNEE